MQVIREELNVTVSALLEQLLEWQERKAERRKGGARRGSAGEDVPATPKRLVAGLKSGVQFANAVPTTML